MSYHKARPDDNPEPGDRCKDCGFPITWLGPSQYDWAHVPVMAEADPL